MIGEVCHFIDTCAAIVGEPARAVHAAGTGAGERVLSDDLIVSLQFPSGSLATIQYATDGNPATEKERIEILGGGHTVVIDDFRAVVIDGKKTVVRPQDKGHLSEVERFRDQVTGKRDPDLEFMESMRTTLLAAASLGGGPDSPLEV